MNYKAIFKSSYIIRGIFIISFFILVFISSITYKHTIGLAESTELIVHSDKIQIQLEQLLSHLKDAETGQRGYIISNDTVYLQPYNSAGKEISKSIEILKKLTVDRLVQKTNLDTLIMLINKQVDLLGIISVLTSEVPINKEDLDINLYKGKKTMDRIRFQINKMTELEKMYFDEHEKKYIHEIYFTPIFTLYLLLFTLMIFVFSYLKINRDMEILKINNENLLITNEMFKHAEDIGEFSSWQWNLDTNQLIYSENQYKLLGCDPGSFESKIENFLEFVHPNDKEIVKRGVVNVISGKEPTRGAFYRIIRKDHEVRYFKSIGKIVNSGKGKRILIGISSDITEQHLSKLALEERNRELEQSNKELASFNHIASHDLQEPLRKIQTFMSRMVEKEMLTMSESGKEYFTKIQASTDRMRSLIDDLLLFSRTTKTEKVYVKTDLNLLLENAWQELAQSIEEQHAKIYIAKLPVLKVIPFQIQQLFINLIGNSLKYSKPHIAPIIKIKCDKINASEEPLIKKDSDQKFYKISITDNGLGFDQQYAESIFILFHRLYHDNEFPGTGIGLSICKKIVENHSGYIKAEGKPGIGSTFTVFLPE